MDILSLEKNSRKAGTFIKGVEEVRANYYVFVDGDNSFDISDIIRVINICQQGYYDIVQASKDGASNDRKMIRRIMSYVKRQLIRPFMPEKIADCQTGLRCMNALSVEQIFPHVNHLFGLASDLQLLYLAKQLKFRVLQVPVKLYDQEGSHVHVIKDSINYLKTLITLSFKGRIKK